MRFATLLLVLMTFLPSLQAYYDGTPGNERYRIATKEETENDAVIKFLNDLYYQGMVKQLADREAVNKACASYSGDELTSCQNAERKKQDDAYFEEAKADGNAVGSGPGTQMAMASSYLEKYRASGELPSFRYIPGAKTYAISSGLQATNVDSTVLENLNNELASAQADEKEWLAKMNAKSCRSLWGQAAALAQCEAEQKEIANQATRAKHRITNTKAAIEQYKMVGYVGAEMQKAADGTGQAPNGYNDQIGADGSGYPWTKPAGSSSSASSSLSTKATTATTLLNSSSTTSSSTSASSISEEERKRLQQNRAIISRQALTNAIELFYGAVATYAEDEVAKQVLGIENLTTALNNSVGVVDNHIGKMDQAGGQFDTTNKSIDDQIAAKIKMLEDNVKAAEAEVTAAQADVNKYSSCSSGRAAGSSYSECSNKYSQAQRALTAAQKKLAAAEKARKAYGEKEQTTDMTKKEGAISDSKNVIASAEGPRAEALAAGEKLYSAQERLNAFINDRSKSAVAVAKQAKAAALELLKTNVNNQFDLSDKADLMAGMSEDERDLLKRVANEEAAQKYIDLFALVGSGAQHFKCETDSDVECVSYHLMVAASAIYLAAQIRETTDFNLNSADIEKTDEDPNNSYDEQYKSLLRAAKMREELLRTAQARMELQQILQDMLTRVNGIAQLELVAKKTRIAAAEQQVKKAEENLKKIQMSIAIMVGIKLVEELVIKKSLAIAAMNWACCGPHSPGCCAIAGKFQALASTWQAKLAVTVAAIAYYGSELIKAQKELRRAKAELAAAKKHTHLRCWKDLSSGTDAATSFLNRPMQFKALVVSLTLSLFPVAHADDSAAIGEQVNTGIYKYYRERKETEAEQQVAAYPTPETRATYMQNIVLEVAQHAVDGSESYLKTLSDQNNEYQKIVTQMNNSAKVNETGQVIGSTLKAPYKGIDTSKLGAQHVVPGNLDFGSLSQFRVTQKSALGTNTANLENISTQSGSVNGTVGGRKAAANVKDARERSAKAQASLNKMKNKATVAKDDSYQQYTRKVLEDFGKRHPESKSFVSKAIADLGTLKDPSNTDAQTDANKANTEKAAEVKVTEGSKSSGHGATTDKEEDGMIMTFDEENLVDQAIDPNKPNSCLVADGKASSVGCMSEEERALGEEALASLNRALGGDSVSGSSTNEGTKEVGIYDGKDSLFKQISKRYVKSALPLFFEKKKK